MGVEFIKTSVKGLIDCNVDGAGVSEAGGDTSELVVGDAGSVMDDWRLVVGGSREAVVLCVVDGGAGSVDVSGGIVNGSGVVVVSLLGLLSPGTQVKSFELST